MLIKRRVYHILGHEPRIKLGVFDGDKFFGIKNDSGVRRVTSEMQVHNVLDTGITVPNEINIDSTTPLFNFLNDLEKELVSPRRG